MRFFISIFFITSFLIAQNFDNHLSFQGYTGVINTPNTEIIKEGRATLHFNNQFDNHLKYYDSTQKHSSTEDYILGIGFLPSFEFTGRLVESKGTLRDLSANIKYKIPYAHEYLPNIAIGFQDVGGAWNLYDNKYLVMDKKIDNFCLSMGYGKSNDKRGKRMDGLFGGLEVDATDWLSFMGEHDGEESHIGVRLTIPSSWSSNFNIDTIIAQNLTDSDTSFAINLSIPLLNKKRDLSFNLENSLELDSLNSNPQTVKQFISKFTKTQTKKESIDISYKLQKRLVDFGFEDVRVGQYNETIYVECENSIFDQNDLDALGYIIGTIVNTNSNYNYYSVTLLKNNIQTLSIGGRISHYKEYLSHPTITNRNKVKESLIIAREFDTNKVEFLTQKANSSFFKPRVELSMGVITTVGTEVGVFDYLASLRTNMYTTIYDGLMVSALYESPFIHSSNFDKNRVYGITYRDRLEDRLISANLHQTVHYSTLLNTISIGQFYTDYIGVINQTNIASDSGNHTLNLKIGILEEKNSNESREVYLGKYRYFYEPLDLFSEITYGQYWNQDRGVTLQLKRFFGESAIALYYKNVGTQYLGIQFSIPFTLQKIPKASSFGQIRGKKDFTYSLRTTIKEDDGTNRLKPSGGVIPEVDFEIENYYLNRDRVNKEYIKENIERMRDSFVKYIKFSNI
jgi:hypothetical protein